MEVKKIEFPDKNAHIPIVITDKYGKAAIKEFIYTDDLWYEENDNGLYSFDQDMNYDWHTKTYTCPKKYIDKMNHWIKKIGNLEFCVCGEAGITAFVKTNSGKFPNHSYIRQWFWKKYKLTFWSVNINRYLEN